MGMTASYFRVTDQFLARLRTQPDLVEEILESEDLTDVELYLDKAWHGIYYLLTGQKDLEKEDPTLVGRAITGGKELGDDLGYGPLRYLNAEEVKGIYHELKQISPNDLSERFDISVLNQHDIYPMGNDWADEDKEYLIDYYQELVDFFKLSTDEEKCILLLIQ